MKSLIMPKADSRLEFVIESLKIYNSIDGKVTNDEFKEKMRECLIRKGMKKESDKIDQPFLIKKSEMARYFELIKNDFKNKCGQITEKGKTFLAATEKSERIEILFEIMEDENITFGRDNSGVESTDSDIEPPIVILKLLLYLEELTKEEIGFSFYFLVYKQLTFLETINEIIKIKVTNSHQEIEKELESLELINKFKDLKILLFFKELSILEENSKKYRLASEIKNNYGNRIYNLKEKRATDIDEARNYLVFGSPGTGKSYLLEEKRKLYFDDNHFERVTFYDGYTYGQFVGSYKPKVKKDKQENDIITYEYIPGPFMKMLVKALKKENRNQKFLVLIEELNRAKADSVFGDIFQLLDREKSGESKYKIDISEDQEVYLKDQGLEGLDKLYIPNNLYVWATMNSADQGVYPLDTAFKRRWSYEYLTLNKNEDSFGEQGKKYKINIGNGEEVEWNKFRKKINEIVSKGNASEDRMLAPFFLVPEDFKKIREEIFILNDEVHKFKLLSYVFDDLLMYDKKSKGEIFNSEIKTFSALIEKYDKDLKDVYSQDFIKKVKDLETNGAQ